MTERTSKSLADLCAPVDRRDPRDDPEATFPYVDIGSIDRDSKRITDVQVLTGANAPSRARQIIRTDDVLVSMVRPNLNAVAIVPRELDCAVASTGFCVLRARKELVLPRYIFFQTRSPAFIESLTATARGAAYPAVSDADVRSRNISVSPRTEQRRIVRILDRADRLRCLRAEAGTRCDRVLPALFIKMFGDPAMNPKAWKEKRIGDICDIVSGGTPKTNRDDYWGGAVAWATPKDLSSLDDWVLDCTERTLTEDGLASCSSTILPEGSVLLSSRAPIGLVAIAGIPVSTNQGFKSLVCGPEMDSWYLFAWCKLQTRFLQSLGHGATFKEVSKGIMEAVRIPLPPLEAQALFRARMEKLHNARQQAREARVQMSALFDQLLERAFSGSLAPKRRKAASRSEEVGNSRLERMDPRLQGSRELAPLAASTHGAAEAAVRQTWRPASVDAGRFLEGSTELMRHSAGSAVSSAMEEAATRSVAALKEAASGALAASVSEEIAMYAAGSLNDALRRLSTRHLADDVWKLNSVENLAHVHSSWIRNMESAAKPLVGLQSQVQRTLDSAFRMAQTAARIGGKRYGDGLLRRHRTQLDLVTRSLTSLDSVASTFERLTNVTESFRSLTALPSFALPSASRELAATGCSMASLVSDRDEAGQDEVEDLVEIRKETASISELLDETDPFLANMYEGAKEAVASRGVDRTRQALVSLRGLWEHLLRILAPDEHVIPWIADRALNPTHNRKPTRRDRLLYICRDFDCRPFEDFVESDCNAFLKYFDLLNRVHQRELVFSGRQLEALVLRTDSWLLFLLQIGREGRGC